MADASSPDLIKLIALWHRLSPDARASLLRIARAKAGAWAPSGNQS